MPVRLQIQRRSWRLAGVSALLGMVSATCIAAATPEPSLELSHAEREGLIFERQQTMSQLQRDGELLGNIVAGLAAREKLGEATRAIANGARDALRDYQNRVPGGRSKPEVWSNNADFMARMEAFARNAEAMAQAGEAGNMALVTERMIEAMPCKQCHDLYREPKKP